MSARSLRPCLLLLLAPLLAAWSTGGSGQANWSDGARARTTSVSVVAHVDDDEVRAVLSMRAGDDGDALIHLRLPRSTVGAAVQLPARRVDARYVGYGADGSTRFEGATPLDGELSILPHGRRWVLRMSARWSDGEVIRALHGLTVWLDAEDAGRSGDGAHDTYDGDDRPSTGGGVTISGGSDTGCDGDDWETEDSNDGWGDDTGGGCDGDDWGSDDSDDWGDDSGGGCEGDDVGGDSDWGDDSGGGCEGDDVGGGDSSADGPSCEGDAVAAGSRTRRSPTIVRLINQLPWLLVLVGIRLARRRERR